MLTKLRRYGNAKLTILACAITLMSPVHATDGNEHVLALVASDCEEVKGSTYEIKAVTDKKGDLMALKYEDKAIPIGSISDKGVTLWTLDYQGISFRVFKLKIGWPKDPSSTKEDPMIDPGSKTFSGSGGNITLSYLNQGGLFSDYKHLRATIKCKEGKCSLFAADGTPADRLFAYVKENRRGLQEIKPVSRSLFAELSSKHLIGRAASVSDSKTKEQAVPASQTDSVSKPTAGKGA